MLAAKAAIEAVVGDEEVEHGGNQCLAILELDALGRHLAHQDARVVGAGEVVVLAIAEVGEGNVGKLVLMSRATSCRLVSAPAAFLLLQVPFALLAPAEPDRAMRHNNRAGRLVEGDRLPLGIVGLAQSGFEIRGAQQPVRHQLVALLHQPHQHRHVGVLAGVILEILGFAGRCGTRAG